MRGQQTRNDVRKGKEKRGEKTRHVKTQNKLENNKTRGGEGTREEEMTGKERRRGEKVRS